MMQSKFRVLFLCTENSCRSQMAEGWARHLFYNQIEAYSAGIEKRPIDERAVMVMKEAGVDISSQYSKTVEELPVSDFDQVVTVCNNARENCPMYPETVYKTHRSFDDPPILAKDCESEEEALVHYRRVRDEIQDFIKTLPAKYSKNLQKK